MNNKLFNLIILFVLLFCFCSGVYAINETSGDVMAKYSLKNGDFYEETLNQNNKINLSLVDRIITIKASDSRDNGSTIVFVPVSSNVLEWLTGSSADKKAYYIDFYKNNRKVSLNGYINIKIKSCNSCIDEKIYYYDSNKNIIVNTTSINNNMNLNLNTPGYLIIEDYKRLVNFDISGNGDLVFNNKSYKNTGMIYSKMENPEIIIRPDNGYVIDKVILNNNDICTITC